MMRPLQNPKKSSGRLSEAYCYPAYAPEAMRTEATRVAVPPRAIDRGFLRGLMVSHHTSFSAIDRGNGPPGPSDGHHSWLLTHGCRHGSLGRPSFILGIPLFIIGLLLTLLPGLIRMFSQT